MFEILLGPKGEPLDPKMPVHDAIRAVLQRSLRFASPCRCSDPWIRVYVADTWRQGKLEVTQIEACCEAQRQAAVLELPPLVIEERQARESGTVRSPGLRPAAASMRLLLDDCELDSGERLADGLLVVPKEGTSERLSVCSRHDSMMVRCDFPLVVDGTRVASLLVRPLYHHPSLKQALREFAPIEVVAYWRRFGFDWSPRSLMAAERFGIGVGGSMTARLTRLFPDVTPRWSGGALQSAAQGP